MTINIKMNEIVNTDVLQLLKIFLIIYKQKYTQFT